MVVGPQDSGNRHNTNLKELVHLQVVQTPHQGFLRVRREIEMCAWLKFGNHRPKLKAPVYKDHTKAPADDEDEE